MILHTIDHLKDDLKKIDDNTYGFKNNCNLIKFDGENYHYIRLDTITSHIEQTHSEYSLKNIKEQIIHKLDYNLEFADDRTNLVNRLLEENTWIYTLVSTERFIKKEIKKKTSFLSENHPYDMLMEIISTYITHAKFKNEEDKLQYEETLKKTKELESVDKRKRTEDHDSELLELENYIQSYHHKLIRQEITSSLSTSKKVELTDCLASREGLGDFIYTEEQSHRLKKITKKYKTEDLPRSYFNKMFSKHRKSLIPHYDKDMYNEELNKSIPSRKFRRSIYKQMKKTVENQAKIIGLDIKNTEIRKKYIENLIKEKGKRYYSISKKMYNELKSDFELTKKLITVQIVPKKLEKSSTVIDINNDTWYLDEHGNEIVLSKNHISLNDPNTYKGLILTYKDLKDKYYNKQDSEFWGLILIFEELLKKTTFTADEQFVLDSLFDNYTQTQIREKYNKLNTSNMTKNKISRLINTTIPNKIRESYLDSLEDWLYVEKIKGSYKTCSKCKKVKLLNDRHFGKDTRNKDNFKSICKNCDNYTK